MKTCSCGTHYTMAEWIALPLVGIYRDDEGAGPDSSLELRNCTTCKSTLAVPLAEKRPYMEEY